MTQRSMHVIADGLTYLEGPRWHQGRLWFVVCGLWISTPMASTA